MIFKEYHQGIFAEIPPPLLPIREVPGISSTTAAAVVERERLSKGRNFSILTSNFESYKFITLIATLRNIHVEDR